MSGGLIDVVVEGGTATRDELVSALAAYSIGQCLPCDARCKPKAIGRFTDTRDGAAIFYPMCRACFDEATDPRTQQSFARALRQRFVKLGEAAP